MSTINREQTTEAPAPKLPFPVELNWILCKERLPNHRDEKGMLILVQYEDGSYEVFDFTLDDYRDEYRAQLLDDGFLAWNAWAVIGTKNAPEIPDAE